MLTVTKNERDFLLIQLFRMLTPSHRITKIREGRKVREVGVGTVVVVRVWK